MYWSLRCALCATSSTFLLRLLLVQFPEEKENRAVEMAGHNDSLIHRDVAIFQHLPGPLHALRESCPNVRPKYSAGEKKAAP
jgi:hypothetical protein